MANRKDQLPKPPSWRNARSARANARPERARSWRKPDDSSSAADRFLLAQRRRRLRRLAVAGAIGLCTAALIVLLLLPSRTRTHLFLVADDGPANLALPVHQAAMRDAQLLHSLGRPRTVTAEITAADADFQRELSHSDPKRVLVVYVSLLAGRDEQGPYLLSYKAQPEQRRTFAPWDALRAGLRTRPAGQKKLLVLDLARVPAAWRFGLLANDWQAEVSTLCDEVPNLVVLCACAPGEKSWTSRDLPGGGGSVFAHFLRNGLAGDADQDRNLRVTVGELFDYVRRETNEWVVQNRDAAGQHPVIFPDRASLAERELDFKVIEVGRTAPAATVVAATDDECINERSQKLWQLCERRDGLRAQESTSGPPYQLDPLRWRRLTAELMRAEEWLQVGDCKGAQEWLARAERTLDDLETLDSWLKGRIPKGGFVESNIFSRVRAPQDNWNPPAGAAALTPRLPGEHLRESLDRFFQTYFPEDPPRDLIDLAVEVRNLGETAAGGPLGTLPLVEELVEQADRRRREGEDRLTLGAESKLRDGDGPERDNRQFVRERFAHAEQGYQEAVRAARQFHFARSVLHRLYADLPELAAWAAFRDPVRQSATAAEVASAAEVTSAARAASAADAATVPPANTPAEILEFFQKHALSTGDGVKPFVKFHRLDEPEMKRLRDRLDEPDRPLLDLLWLFKATHQLETALDDLLLPDNQRPADAHQDRLQRIQADAETALVLTNKLENDLKAQAERLLQLPVEQPQYSAWRAVHSALQNPLLPGRLRRDLNRQLREYSRRLQQRSKDSTAARPQKSSSPDPREAAAWHAFWANHVVWLGGAGGNRDDALWRLWDEAWRGGNHAHSRSVDFNPPDKGTTQSAQQNVANLGDAIRTAWERKRARVELLARPIGLSPEEARRELMLADRLARSLHAYDADRLLGEKLNPAVRLADFYAAELCLAQAERYLEDFRFGWYDRAADACLAAAAKFAEGVSPLNGESALVSEAVRLEGRRQDLLNSSIRLEADYPHVTFGSSSRRNCDFQVIGGKAPAGVAAVWMDATPPLFRSSRVAAPSAGGAVALPLVRNDEEARSANCQPLSLKPLLWFRGHTWADLHSSVEIQACLTPERPVVYRSAPRTGSILVEGEDRRSILFILDCSGSMEARLGAATRFQTAEQTLRNTLQALNRRDQTQRAGLMAYGHRVKLARDENNKLKSDTNKNWPHPIPDDAKSDVLKDVEILVDVSELNGLHLKDLNKALDSLTSFGNTPLLRAVLNAGREFKKRNTPGIVVAISDGEYQDGHLLAPLRTELATLRERGIPIQLHIVGFAVDAAARKLLQDLAQQAGGMFHNAPGGLELANALTNAVAPRPFHVKRTGPDPLDWGNSPLGRGLAGLPPGEYELGFPDCTPVRVRIAGGEGLVFQLKEHKLQHDRLPERPSKGDVEVRPRSDAAEHPTRFGYRSFSIGGDDSAKFLVSLWHEDESRFVRRPAEIHFEIAPQGEEPARRRSVNWGLAPDYSAPTWEVTLQDWPKEERATIHAWWNMERTQPDVLKPERWERIAAGTKIRMPDGAELDLSAEYHREAGAAVVKLAAPQATPLDPKSVEELARIRVELGRDTLGFEPVDFSSTSVFREDGTLVIVFQVGQDFRPEQFHVAVTSWQKRKEGATVGVLEGIKHDEAAQ